MCLLEIFFADYFMQFLQKVWEYQRNIYNKWVVISDPRQTILKSHRSKMSIIYNLLWNHIYIYILAQVQFESTPSCLPCTCSNQWDICLNDETWFVLILNFRKCFRQNQISPFPVPYLIKKFPARIKLCSIFNQESVYNWYKN